MPPVSAAPPRILTYQQQLNRGSAPQRAAFLSHRERVMALLTAAASGGSLAVLGAGNCNDLDLPPLTTLYAGVHLADLDREALRRARDAQPPEVAARLVLHAPLDLSGGLNDLSAAARTPAAPHASALADAAQRRITRALPGPFDTVVSACLVSQIAQSCRLLLGMDHPRLFPLAEALVSAHLRALLALTRPGGTAVLVTDVVSSETYPLEELAAEQPLHQLLDHLQATDNLLTGTQPRFLRRFFTRDPVAAPLMAGPPRMTDPWLWRVGGDLTLLAYALVLVRSRTELVT
jgi:hypothetical protein